MKKTKNSNNPAPDDSQTVALKMGRWMVKGVDEAGKRRHRCRSEQIRAMVEYLLLHRKVLSGI